MGVCVYVCASLFLYSPFVFILIFIYKLLLLWMLSELGIGRIRQLTLPT